MGVYELTLKTIIQSTFLENMKKSIPFLLLLILILLSACGSGGHVGADARVVKGDEILIGVAWPFAAHGDQFEEGLDLAIQEINQEGGINGYLLQLEKHDDAVEVTRGMEIAQAFATNPNILAVIGHRNSYVSIPVSEIYELAGIPMITPASTSPDLIHEHSKYTFRGLPADDQIAAELVAFAAREGISRIAIYYGAHDYGRGLANAFEKHALQHGIQIVDRTTFLGDSFHQQQLFEKWKSLQVEAVMVADNAGPSRFFIDQMRHYGTELPILAGNALDTKEVSQLIRTNEDIVIIGSTFSLEDDRPMVRQFIERYTETYGMLPNQYAAQGYASVYLLKDAIIRAWKESNHLSSTAITAALHEGMEIETVTGLHRFTTYGENVGQSVVLKKVRLDGYEYIQATP